jgi:hypothetical protein
MHTFLLDLWHDMREKRLWPFAALLLVAIAAVPFTMTKKEEPAPPTATPPTQAQTAADKLPTIAQEDASAEAPSNLTEFNQKNPFKPISDLPKVTKDDTNETVNLGDSPGGGSGKGGSGSGSGSAGSGSGKAGGGSSGASASSGGSSGGGSGSGAGSYVGPRTTYYTYRADIKFGVAGKAKTMKQVEAFTLLGDDKEPAAMFMGVTDDHEYAVFAVDTARYESEGEHECKPSPDRCEFVYLKVADDGDETTLTKIDGSTSYDLQLTAIKRIVLDKKDVADVPTESDRSGDAASKKRAKADPEPKSFFDIFAKSK